MTKTIVHVTTLEQWKSVLDVWYKQGYDWADHFGKYNDLLFEEGARFLHLDDYITYTRSHLNYQPYIEYSEFTEVN